jgi:hypothetical protein
LRFDAQQIVRLTRRAGNCNLGRRPVLRGLACPARQRIEIAKAYVDAIGGEHLRDDAFRCRRSDLDLHAALPEN